MLLYISSSGRGQPLAMRDCPRHMVQVIDLNRTWENMWTFLQESHTPVLFIICIRKCIVVSFPLTRYGENETWHEKLMWEYWWSLSPVEVKYSLKKWRRLEVVWSVAACHHALRVGHLHQPSHRYVQGFNSSSLCRLSLILTSFH